MNGSDIPSNIVTLMPEEHFVAHQLLAKIYPDCSGLIYAAVAMTVSPHGNGKRVNNRLYGWLRRRYSETVSKQMKGNKYAVGSAGAWKGKKRPDISERMKGNLHGLGNKGITGQTHIGYWKGKKNPQLSAALKGRVPWNKGKRKTA